MFRIIRLSCLFLCLCAGLPAFGQLLSYENSIRLDTVLAPQPFRKALRAIGEQQGFAVFFMDSLSSEISGDFRGKPLAEFLQKGLEPTELRYFWFDARNLLLFSPARLEEKMSRRFIGNLSANKPADQAQENGNVTYTPANKERKREIFLKGSVRDAAGGEALYGSSVYLQELGKGVTTDFDGNFQLRVPPGLYHVKASAVGYEADSARLVMAFDGQLQVHLFERSIRMKEAVVTASATDQQVNNLASGQEQLTIKTIEKMPAFLGEVDVIRSITLLPGISTTGEGSAGFQVRGGSADQNLVLLDGVPVFQTAHLFGFFSAFHPDRVQQATVYKGSMPAEYGGRVSSVLDVRSRSGNAEKIKLRGGIGVVSSRLAVDGPLWKANTTFAVGGRTTYSDWILGKVNDFRVRQSRASFQDAQATVKHAFSENDQVLFSGYLSADRFRFGADTLYRYKSQAASLSWNHAFPNRSLLDVSTFYSGYGNNTSGGELTDAFTLHSGIELYGSRANFTFSLRSAHQLKAGISTLLYQVEPGGLSPASTTSDIIHQEVQTERGLESAVFLADQLTLSPRLAVEAGLRYSVFQELGPKEVYLFSGEGLRRREAVIDTLTYSGYEKIARYGGLEPRLSIRYLLSFYQSVKLSYNRTRQYIHLMSNTATIAPVDFWKLSSRYIAPQLGDQLSMGYFQQTRDGRYEFSAETYYKWLHQLVEYKDGAQLLLNPLLEADLLQARGKAYGLELMGRKKEGRLTGWASYTFSRSLRQTTSQKPGEQINRGAFFPSNFDKPHDLTLIGNYQFSRRWSFAANFTYSTGRPTTYAEGRYVYDGIPVPDYSDRNQYRIPDYHRLDIGITLSESLKKNKKWTGSWTFSVYNVYAHKNAFSVYFKSSERQLPGAYQFSILGVPFPSVTYNFTFK